MNLVELAPFPAFLKDTKKRDIVTLGRSSNAIQKPLLYAALMSLPRVSIFEV